MVFISRTGLTTTSVTHKLAWVICILYLELYLAFLRWRGLRPVPISEYNRALEAKRKP